MSASVVPASHMGGSATTSVSVIICTFNRCDSLAETLASLQAMQVPQYLRWNIIVVDNNSTDRTKDVVEQFARDATVEVRYLFEEAQGVSYAKNRGILATDSEYVAFTDDDVLVDRNWLKCVAETFATYNADCVGGKIIPAWLGQRPEWLGDHLLNVLAMLDYGDDTIELYSGGDNRMLFGANYAFKRESLLKAGLFATNLGRVGDFGSGEDKDIVEKVKRDKGRIIYSPAAVVSHKVPPERMRKTYFRRWHYQAGKDRAKMTRKSRFTVFGIESYLFRDFLRTTLRLLGSVLGREPDCAFEYELGCIMYLSVFKHKLVFRRSSH